MQAVVSFIQDVGFPIFVSCFLLIRIEPTLKKIGETMAQILIFLEEQKKC